jgi:hypothetical protein
MLLPSRSRTRFRAAPVRLRSRRDAVGGRPLLIQRWLGFLVLRRAYRVLLADGSRPLAQRLTHEAKRLVVAALAIVLLLVGVVAAAVVVAIVYLT